MYLFVDPTREKLRMELWNEKGVLAEKEYLTNARLSQHFLSWIDEFLSEHSVKKEDLKGLAVVKGPGSFMTLRVVISTSNALGYALDIPVLGVEKNEGFSKKMIEGLVETGNFKGPVAPYYKEPPKITAPKKK